MEQYITNPWMSALIVLITQILFIYLRTINVVHISQGKRLEAIISGMGIGIFWLVTMALGANAVLKLQWQPIIAHLIGGAVGTYWGFNNKK